MLGFYSFLRLNNTLLHTRAVFCLPVCWWACGCFHFGSCGRCCYRHWCTSVCFSPCFPLSGSVPRSRIAGSCSNSKVNFLRNCCAVCTVAASFYFSAHSIYGFRFLYILSTTWYCHIPVGVRRYLTVVVICISLRASDVEHLFMFLLASCIYSFQKCLFSVLCPCFKLGGFVVLVVGILYTFRN